MSRLAVEEVIRSVAFLSKKVSFSLAMIRMDPFPAAPEEGETVSQSAAFPCAEETDQSWLAVKFTVASPPADLKERAVWEDAVMDGLISSL